MFRTPFFFVLMWRTLNLPKHFILILYRRTFPWWRNLIPLFVVTEGKIKMSVEIQLAFCYHNICLELDVWFEWTYRHSVQSEWSTVMCQCVKCPKRVTVCHCYLHCTKHLIIQRAIVSRATAAMLSCHWTSNDMYVIDVASVLVPLSLGTPE